MAWNQEVANQTRFVWARRDFRVTPTQAESLAVLRWNRIASGAAALINGHKVGENEPTGPFQVIVPAGILKPGENQIVLEIRGAAGVRPWTYEKCPLYIARVKLTGKGRILDEVTFRFGMREIGVKDRTTR